MRKTTHYPAALPAEQRIGTRLPALGLALLALSVSIAALLACGGKVFIDSADSTPSDPNGVNVCAASCAAQNPHGFEMVDVGASCMCDGCSTECNQSVCAEHEVPSDACLPCVKAGLLGDHCQNHHGLFGHCLTGTGNDCALFVSCLLACPDPT